MSKIPTPVVVIVIIILLIVIIIAGVIGYYNYQANKAPEQAQFNKGTVSADLPNGPYNGSATVAMGSWLGKRFDASAKTGVNRFADGDRYTFSMYPGQGLSDPRDVIKIDYNQSANPWWLRLITDEIVQTGQDEYLGKIQIRVIPGVTLTYGYFRLSK